MADDLIELHERLAWTREKRDTLNAQVVQLRDRSIKCWAEQTNPFSGAILAKMLEEPPVKLRIEVGLLVHEQRAILDALACRLAERNGANHTTDVYFPITRDKVGFDQLGRKKIRKLTTADRDAIEALAPWGDGHDFLFLLHEADRVRKHQKLLQWACLGGAFAYGTGSIGFMAQHGVIFQEVGRAENLCDFQRVTCEIGARFNLVYLEPEALHARDVMELVNAFDRTVTQIVSSFD